MNNPHVRNRTIYLPFKKHEYDYIVSQKIELVKLTGEDISLASFVRMILLDALKEGAIKKYATNHYEYVEAIPISQLKEWQKQYGNKCTYGTIIGLVEEWRKDN